MPMSTQLPLRPVLILTEYDTIKKHVHSICNQMANAIIHENKNYEMNQDEILGT